MCSHIYPQIDFDIDYSPGNLGKKKWGRSAGRAVAVLKRDGLAIGGGGFPPQVRVRLPDNGEKQTWSRSREAWFWLVTSMRSS